MTSRRAPARTGTHMRLVIQLVAILSIAVLPLGLISVFQTSAVLKESRALSEVALLQKTSEIISGERELIQSAIGAARALSSATSVLNASGSTCVNILSRVVEQNEHYSFAGYVSADNELRCASNGARGTISAGDVFTASESDDLQVTTGPSGVLNGQLVLGVGVPVFEADRYLGSVWIAIPYTAPNRMLSNGQKEVDLVIFDVKGEILATEAFTDDRRAPLPSQVTLQDLSKEPTLTFRDLNRAGDLRDFAVVPIIENVVYGLGSWEPQDTGILPIASQKIALYFPLLMWIAAMLVAYFGVNRLVIRHIYRLRNWMLMYLRGRRDFSDAQLDRAPEELEIVAETFRNMTVQLSEHEARRNEDLAEKTVLLKEVHHRVKNNLQLIASIMNMQIRKATSQEARTLLRRVQDRVMALSSVHRILYTAPKLSLVQASDLLEGIVSQLVAAGTMEEAGRHIEISTHFCPAEISPDQALPLSLLATEATINAVKYCGAEEGEDAWIQIVLREQGNGVYCFSVVNSLPEDTPEQDKPDAESGLGARLMDSFVLQLDGEIEVNDLPNRYEIHVTFAAKEADLSDMKIDF